MQTRLQEINGDTVLEVIDADGAKTRYSEKTLLRRQEYFQNAIGKFQAGLTEVNGALAQIYAQKDRAQ